MLPSWRVGPGFKFAAELVDHGANRPVVSIGQATMVVPGMMPMLPANSKSMSRSLESASPASIREAV